MSKTNKIFFNTITLLLLNTVFFIGNIYPRHILETSALKIDFYITVFNFLYHLVFFSFLVFYISKDKTLFSNDQFIFNIKLNTNYIKKVVALLVLQFVTDFARIQISSVIDGKMYLFNNIITVIYWLFVWGILVYKNNIKFKDCKSYIYIVLFIAFVAGIFAVLDINKLEQYNILHQKYNAFNVYATQKLANYDFIHSVENFLLDTLMGVAAILYFTFAKSEEYEKEKGKSVGNKPSKLRVFVKNSLRIEFLFLLFFFMCWIDVIFVPQNSIRNLDIVSLRASHFVFDNTFNSSCFEFSISRMDRDGNENICYKTVKKEISNNNKKAEKTIKVSEINTDKYEILDNYEWDGEGFVDKSEFKEYLLNDNIAYVFRNCAICYVESDVPKIVEFDEIADSDENKVITEICKQMIAEGNFAAFVFSCDYLNKYDKAFIEPYINRYSKADFTPLEMEYLKVLNYRPEYIQNVAEANIT